VAALVVTCPCGLAIAVPALQVVAAGALFRQGGLLARPGALERLASADHVVLDKTGTLTEGRPRLLPGDYSPEILRRAAASRHPLAQALLRACPGAPLTAGVEEIPGQGLSAAGARPGSARTTGMPAIAIARRAQAIARQNIGFSLAYDLVAVPMAVAGLMTPLMAASVVASSSLIVILNALGAGRVTWTR